MYFSRWLLLVSTIITISVASANVSREAKDTYPNYDIRDPENAAALSNLLKDQSHTAAARQGMEAARASLAERLPGLHLEKNALGAPEIVESTTQFLVPASPRAHVDLAREFLARNAAVFGLTREQIDALVKTADYANPAGNMSWVRFRQEANGIPIFQGEMQAAFSAQGALARLTGNLAPALDYPALPTTAKLSPAEAAAKSAASVGRTLNVSDLAKTMSILPGNARTLAKGPFTQPIRTDLVYFPLEPGTARLAFWMILWDEPDAYYVVVDAQDGTLLWRKDITDHQAQTATYGVYLDDDPGPLSPSNALPGSGIQGAGIGRSTVTLIGNEPPNTFNNLGWITDGNNTTSGNNVDCGLDISSPNGIDTNGRAVGSPNRVFDFPYSPPPMGTDAPTGANYRSGIVTNLFYWSNVYHDRLYLLGFTEPARNFQTNNFGRGGSGSDAVSAQAQDSSGTNNANFSTPPDGSPGVMQMYLFTGPSPQRDGSIDGNVFLHELTHGLSNRLHNNGSGLTTQQAGGMGEGWSDFYARALLSTAEEDVHGVYPSGGYVTLLLGTGFTDNYYYGIRRFPYAVKANLGANGKPHNASSYGDIDFAQIDMYREAYPPSPIIGLTANEVHNIGTVWCMMLLEVRARMIDRLGWSVGNQRALQIVTDAMKLDVSSPTMLQARDSLIAADNAGFAGADVPDIRSGFAVRGAGAGATVSGSTNLTVVESLYPSSAAGTITFSDSLGNNNGVAEPGEDLVFSIPLTNRLTNVDNNVAATLGNFSANYGNIAAGATVIRTFNYRVPGDTACGTTLQIPLVVTSPNGIATVNVPLQVGAPANNVTFSENFDGVVAPALPAGWTTTTTGVANSAWVTATSPVVDAANSAHANDVSQSSDSSLVSPVIALGSNQRLSFKHRFTFETPFDGGALEIKIGAGSFTDIITAGGSFVQKGYGATIASSATGNPLIRQRVWSGTISTTATVIVDLPPAAAGQNVQFRWRLGCDSSTSSTGWNIDSVQVYSTSFSCADIDSDDDGIPDGWEVAHGLNPADSLDAAQDFDGDGMSNLQEYQAGTDPMDPASVFRILSVTSDPGSGAALSFASVNGKRYRIEYNDNITSLAGWLVLQDDVIGTGAEIPITDPGAVGVSQRFYRAVLKQ